MRADHNEFVPPKPKRTDKCYHKGCTNKAAWFVAGQIWPNLKDQKSYPPLELETGLQFCDEHKGDEVSTKVKTGIAYAAVEVCKEMGKVPPDIHSLEIRLKPLSEASIK